MLIDSGADVSDGGVRHARYVTFQMAEVAIPGRPAVTVTAAKWGIPVYYSQHKGNPKMPVKGTSRGIAVASVLIAASFAGLILSDLLPPTIENYVVLVAMCSLGIGALALVVSLAVIVTRAASRHSWQFGFRSFLIAVLTVALFLGIAMAWGVRSSAFWLVVVLQLVTPVLFVKHCARSGSALKAALQGAGIAFVSFVVLGMIYALVIGIEGGYPFPDIGPGLSGLYNFPVLAFVSVIAVWPIPVVLLAGAVGGVVGRKLRDRTPKNRPS